MCGQCTLATFGERQVQPRLRRIAEHPVAFNKLVSFHQTSTRPIRDAASSIVATDFLSCRNRQSSAVPFGVGGTKL